MITKSLATPLLKSVAAVFLVTAIGTSALADEPAVIASDNASATNYPAGNWAAGSNGGTGFGQWSLPGSAGNGGFNGTFIGTAAGLENYSELYSSDVAFSIYAGGEAAFQDALRPFTTALTTGQTLSFSIGFSFDNGNKGFALNSGGNGSNEVFFFNINDTGYTWGGNGSAPMTAFAGVRENGVVINFTFTRTSTGFSYTINSSQDAELTQSGDVTAAGIGSLKFYISGAGGGDPGNLYFNNLQIVGTPAPEGNRTVTFNVDMSVQESLGNFNPETGSVVVVGTFNDWSTENGTIPLSNVGNGVYSGNGSIFGSEGSTVLYKFFNTTPGAPNDGFEAGGDRSLDIGPIDEDQTVPVVYFSNQLPSRVVSFSVNMTEQIALGNFNTETGNVVVVGGFNGFSPSEGAIALVGSGEGIYSGNGSISGLKDATVAYKFFNTTAGAPNFGYEAGADRVIVLGDPGVAQEEPLVAYRMPASPSIVSAASANGTVGTSFAYQIQVTPSANDWETSYALFGETSLPDGLTLNTGSGLISGDPTTAGETSIQLTASNVGGTGAAFTLDLSITQSGGAYDSWAAGYSLTGESAEPGADPDGDGFTNQQEYAFGTNPTQATAGLVATSNSGGDLIVSFLTRDNLSYGVESTNNLASTPFALNEGITIENGPTDPAPPTGYIRKQFTITPTGDRNFYRVIAMDQPQDG
jgi:hypothetical protein